MVQVRSPVYFYRRNEIFYFSRAVPSDLCHRLNKKKIEVSLRTKSEAKAAKSAAALSDRLEQYWDSLRMEMIYSRELGMSVIPDEVSNANQTKLSFSDGLALYQRLKGTGKSNLFFKVSTRSIRYLQECLGHNKIVNLKPADAGLLRTTPISGAQLYCICSLLDAYGYSGRSLGLRPNDGYSLLWSNKQVSDKGVHDITGQFFLPKQHL